jgi:murein DD-endopeptidase MepM/ murein hydrolase activator NlpD
MNMVKAVQAALGVTVDGKYGTETLKALKLFGFKGLRVGAQITNTLSRRLEQIINSDFVWPTTGTITSPYSLWRVSTDPRYKSGPHRAIDIANSKGTPIAAIADGTVSNIYPSEISGNIIEIDYGGGVKTAYHHLSGYADNIAIGTQVSQGQVVGYMGSTGSASTGSHLHFELWMNGERVNPNNYLPPWQ